MILVIDNYDSFTWNLVHYLMEMGAKVEVVRNDAMSAGQAISSGVPLLGVCLGHQSIGQYFGGQVVRGGLMHGKTSPVTHDGSGLFAGLPSPFTATRYHSLVVENVPENLTINATSDDGHAMGFRHASLPIHGVQFHPESIATEHGHALLANFLKMCGITAKMPTHLAA